MNYIITEIQTNNGATAIVPPIAYSDRNQAEAKYHAVLTAAAVSPVEIHTCTMTTMDGKLIKSECYRHQAE